MTERLPTVTANPWSGLRAFTEARIALGRAGTSLPTAAHLAFQLAHAKARDAVHVALDPAALATAITESWPGLGEPCLLHSAARDRSHYLQRPDLGRRLDEASTDRLAALRPVHDASATPDDRPFDLAMVVADWRVAPVCIALQARVALGDDIGERLGARAVAVLIGERPGLSSPDSMGLYLTWMPRVGLTDASRNCISNVRPAGLGFDAAAFKLSHLLTQARQRQLSGVALKDDTGGPALMTLEAQANFLLR